MNMSGFIIELLIMTGLVCFFAVLYAVSFQVFFSVVVVKSNVSC